jgi:ribosomal protein RSM22 (predicted rRNA methylase)
VLGELKERAPAMRVERVLDLGAGPGAATWAALAQWDTIARVTLVERDRGFIDLGRRVMAAVASGIDVNWQGADLRSLTTLSALASDPPNDVVIISYALGELDADAAQRVVEHAWAAAGRALVIVEPGTPRHFARLLDVRDRLIRAGALIVAPCPHHDACPMASAAANADARVAGTSDAANGSTTDWCHMPARVERTSLHRRLKAAALPYEDEKFSYLIATRDATAAIRTPARIVHRPEVQKSFVALTLCTREGLHREGVPRSRGDAFRRARKADWGDAWDESGEE